MPGREVSDRVEALERKLLLAYDRIRDAEADAAFLASAHANAAEALAEAVGKHRLRATQFNNGRLFQKRRAEKAEADAEALAEALAIIPPSNLRYLAEWLDEDDLHMGRSGDAVQRDLRKLADAAEVALARHRGEKPSRDPQCVERWPECEDGTYDPRCCRFPKSCSCTLRPSSNVLARYRGEK